MTTQQGVFLDRLGIASITESKTNPRRAIDKVALAELTESVRAHGVLQPLIVRANGETRHELVAGHRRLAAARAAGLTSVPAIMRELTDKEVLEIQVIENLQRTDLHPLEEAEGYQRLHREFGYQIEELAAKVGKSKSYVYARMKLADLAPKVKALLVKDEFPVSVALKIARIPDAKLQEKAGRLFATSPHTHRDASRIIADEYMLRLSAAPWSLTEVGLAGAVACSACPHRTGNQRELFEDIKGDDLCTNPPCHEKKMDAHWQRTKAEAEKSGQRVLSEAEAKKAFEAYRDDHPKSNSGLIRADGASYEYGCDGKSLKTRLGKDAPPTILARSPQSGNIVTLYERKAVERALKESGKWERGRSSESSTTKKQNESALVRREVSRRVLAAVSSKALKPTDQSWWRWFLGCLAGAMWSDTVKETVRARGLTVTKTKHGYSDDYVVALKASLTPLSAAQLQQLATELVLRRHLPTGNWGGWTPEHDVTCKQFGVDRKKLEAVVLKERAAAKKTAKQKTAKKAKRRGSK